MPSAPEKKRPRWGCWLPLALAAALLFFGWDRFKAYEAAHPEDFPWTPLSLADPVGAFTDDKLAGLTEDAPRCRALIAAAGLGDRPAPPRRASDPACGYEDGIRLGAEEGSRLSYGDVETACPVAAALALWEREVVQPAARRHLGSEIKAIDQLGSYSCRRLYGRETGGYSQHATANAIDIAGFRLEDGKSISVLREWDGDTPEARFLHDVKEGACRLFRTVLSPDYNEAHADHLHLDMAAGRPAGWSICR